MNKFAYRKIVIIGFISLIFGIYILKLLHMQVIDNSYEIASTNNSRRIVTQYPARGLMFDRNGKLLVYNQAAYDLMIIPRQVQSFDTTELINILEISKETLEKSIARCRRYSPYKASILISQITDDKYAILQEKLYKYTGFYIQTRTLRKYSVTHSAEVFGYIGEVSQSQIDRDSSYIAGDYIGINGLEKTYESILRGEKGKKILLVDNYNRVKGSYQDGKYDESAIVGKNITTTLDIDLQEYAYSLMQNKKGGIVAIDPSTGEILLKISNPSYDPHLLVGLKRGKNYRQLQNDSNLPLFDRAVSASYPPGSIFKTVQGLIGLQEGVITPSTYYECHGGNVFNGILMRCHHHTSPLDFRSAIQNSCNPYFVNVFRRILENPKYNNVRNSYDVWRDYVTSFGLGSTISPDFMNETSGFIPTQAYYDSRFRTQNWYYTYIMSLAIGQGELLLTPLQMANVVSCIANRGYYETPHIVRPVDREHEMLIQHHDIAIDSSYFEVVIDGMENAVKNGTARAAMVDSIAVCGKTGTIQNPHGADHSAFFAFAPREDPKIALIVYVENGEWGGIYAAPIAGLIIEKYLRGEISPNKKALEKRMMDANLIDKK